MKMSLRIDGGKALAETLRQMEASLSRRVQINALKEAAEPIRARMAELAPRGNPDRPNLHERIVVNVERDADIETATVAVGPAVDVFYGSFQELADEYGGVHHPAQPFARPAFDAEAVNALNVLVDELWWTLRRGTTGGREKFVG